jgi:hypothetical protein
MLNRLLRGVSLMKDLRIWWMMMISKRHWREVGELTQRVNQR